ncbi:MAG: outer membrane lipoprotein-sorting protein [Kordiimonadaceae bacterium]|jgi:hypothetical protein|nr:outer membrane lipoprotein-sorting protein [Kordiimonadaceae bacterium]
MNKVLLAALGVMLSMSAVADSQARDIMEKAYARDDGSNAVSTMQMILIDKNDKKRIRLMRTFSKDIDANTEHKVIFFLSPSDVKNTAFLTYDYKSDDKDDDQWMYLPALKKTKRIPSSDKGASFMGSDFSYSDMTAKDLDDYTYKLLGESSIKRSEGTESVWKIEAMPVSQAVIDETGYTKSVLYIRKDNYVLTRAKFYLKKANRVKYMDVRKMEKIDDIWVVMQTTMTTKKGSATLHKTILTNSEVDFNVINSDDMFTIRSIEKGL